MFTQAIVLSGKKYSVDIYTADVKGAGTDASVFMTMFGEKGDTGERKLHQSETNKDKFERGKVITNCQYIFIAEVFMFMKSMNYCIPCFNESMLEYIILA